MDETKSESPILLDLDAPQRVACYRSGGKIYKHIFGRISAQDWLAFFSNVTAEFERRGAEIEQLIDTDHASLVLYGRAIRTVEGFSCGEGVKPEELSNWPECVPQDHRMRAVDILMGIAPSPSTAADRLDVEGKTVSLDAVWNEGEAGKMRKFFAADGRRGLLHCFRVPTAEHRRRFLRAKNRAFVAGGSRRGRTIIPSSHAVLVALYDELIESVDGYSLRGAPIAPGDIAREMDAVHKAIAVRELFPTSVEVDEEEAGS